MTSHIFQHVAGNFLGPRGIKHPIGSFRSCCKVLKHETCTKWYVMNWLMFQLEKDSFLIMWYRVCVCVFWYQKILTRGYPYSIWQSRVIEYVFTKRIRLSMFVNDVWFQWDSWIHNWFVPIKHFSTKTISMII